MAEQLGNSLATTTLAADLAIDGTELTLADDAEFPTGPVFRIALFDNRYNPTAIELVTVTAGGNGVAFPWTITRASEGTTAAAWSTGDYAACVATAAGLSAWILEAMTGYAATLTGPQGEQGEPGPQGEAGPIGPEGPAGPQGLQGIQGPAGADGADGAAGPQGEQGPAGAQGPQGEQGPAGAQGPAGPAGADGADGASAYEVAVANGYEGTQEAWLASLVGPQGPAGAAGADGADGAQGPQGEQGIQGPAGADGADGATTFTALTDTPAAYTDQGGKFVAVNAGATALEFVAAPKTAGIVCVIDGGGAAIEAGLAGWLEVPFACTITAARLVADQAGSIVVDLWVEQYADLPATDADSITASAPPTLSAAQKSEDTTLTGWAKTLAAGDWLYVNVDSASTVERVTLTLRVER